MAHINAHKWRLFMHIDNVRMNITLPREVADALNRMAGPRKRSRFIAEAVLERINREQKEALELALEEGYRVNGEEALAISEEFESVDLEGWGEY